MSEDPTEGPVEEEPRGHDSNVDDDHATIDDRPSAPPPTEAGDDPDDPTPHVPDEGTTTEMASVDGTVPDDVQRYKRFTKLDKAEYERVNEFLRDRTYITAREWAIARLCTDFRTETGIEMTKIGENLPELVPFMTETYSPQAVNQARAAFETKVRKSGATFLYGAMCDFFSAEELDDVLYEATEVARFLLEVEGVELDLDEELEAEERIATVMREVRTSSEALRHDGATCPECGHRFTPENESD